MLQTAAMPGTFGVTDRRTARSCRELRAARNMRTMRWLGLAWTNVFFVLSACGGRSPLELAPPNGTAGAYTGGTAGGPAATSTATAGSFDASGGRAGVTLGTPSMGGAPAAAGGASNAGGTTAGGESQGVSGNTTGDSTARKIATSISVGVDMACATVTDGSVWCWGDNDDGQLGDGTTTTSDVPVRVVGIDDAVAVTAGGTWNGFQHGAARFAYGCALLRDHSVRCWGDLGGIVENPDVRSSAVPMVVPGVTDAATISGGAEHVCALTRTGLAECWGYDTIGDLVEASGMNCSESSCPDPGPQYTPGIAQATAVSGKGSAFDCAVLSDGSVECWGPFQGRPGASVNSTDVTPVVMPSVTTTARGLDVGYNHACAISPDARTVQCWGSNLGGALGNGTDDNVTGPVTVQGLYTLVVGVASGGAASCALLDDGSVRGWGDHSTGGSLTPVAVPGITDAVAVSAGYANACALTQAGRIACFSPGFSTPPVMVSGF